MKNYINKDKVTKYLKRQIKEVNHIMKTVNNAAKDHPRDKHKYDMAIVSYLGKRQAYFDLLSLLCNGWEKEEIEDDL